MDFKYADEQNALMIVALLKKHGIKRAVVSPGTTNICLNTCMQHDGSFEMFSCIDERSAAYMACGIAAETGDPVVISCTEATASRDYLPGLTEAYHRKLPILAITGTHGVNLVGHLSPQTIDRSVSPIDSFRLKVTLPILKDENDVWESQLKINQAILELKRHGGGPVHINMPMPKVFYTFTTQELPDVKVINRYLPAMHYLIFHLEKLWFSSAHINRGVRNLKMLLIRSALNMMQLFFATTLASSTGNMQFMLLRFRHNSSTTRSSMILNS